MALVVTPFVNISKPTLAIVGKVLKILQICKICYEPITSSWVGWKIESNLIHIPPNPNQRSHIVSFKKKKSEFMDVDKMY
ncbi:MAG: hypothetical protein ACJ71P_20340 [Nitrososphaeraceae archaeon]